MEPIRPNISTTPEARVKKMGELHGYKCDHNFEQLLSHNRAPNTWLSSYAEGRNRRDPFAIPTIPTTILHDPPTIPRSRIAILVTFVAPLLLL